METAVFLKIDALLDRLTPGQKKTIRLAFRKAHRPPKEANLLLADWVRIAETAHQHALKTALQTENILLSPSVRRRRDRQLRQAKTALERAIAALNQATALLEKHRFGMEYDALHQYKGSIEAQLRHLRDTAERYRVSALTWPNARNRSGNTLRWIPDGCLGEVLAAYFRHRDLPLSSSRSGLFSAVAAAVLSRRAMNDKTVRRLVHSSADYGKLEAMAPRGVKPAMTTSLRTHLLDLPRRAKGSPQT